MLFQLLGLQLRLHEKGEYFYVEQMDASVIVADEPDLDTSTVKLTGDPASDRALRKSKK